MLVIAWGGGGGGGGGALGTGSAFCGGGAGGGGALFAYQWFDGDDLPDEVDVHTGLGGTGGSNAWTSGSAIAGDAGVDGEESWFGGYLFAYGGGGGCGGQHGGILTPSADGGGGAGLRGNGGTGLPGSLVTNAGDGGGAPGHGIFSLGSADNDEMHMGSGGGYAHLAGYDLPDFPMRGGNAIWGGTGGGGGATSDSGTSFQGAPGGANVYSRGGVGGDPTGNLNGHNGYGGSYLAFDDLESVQTNNVHGSGTGAGGGGFLHTGGDHSAQGGNGGFPGGGGGGGSGNRANAGATGSINGGDGGHGLVRVWSFF